MIPKHIAIIMDGNGRWAKERKLPRVVGHRQGVQRVREIVRAAGELGVRFLTLYAFSLENWSRPKQEIEALMRYLNDFLDKEIKDLDKKNMRFKVIGRGSPLPEIIQKKIKKAEDQTKDNTGLTLVLALNYGSRQEIVDGIKKFAKRLIKGEENLEDFNEEKFQDYLYTAGMPDPDLLIRTSGELRISNFLLWQLSYAEFYFPKKCWPDFKKKDLIEAIEEYSRRNRRFGGIDVKAANS